ncbi:coiled-coil domain-containing protein 115 [Rhinophrynus dorsalis]
MVPESIPQLYESLDELVLQLMSDLEILHDKRDALNKLIEKGWFSLSQSRYSMGNKFVSSLQYKQDMVPSVVVQDSTTEDGKTEFCLEHKSGEPDVVERGEPPVVEEIGSTEQVLRRRKGTTQICGSPKRDEIEESGKGQKPPPNQDPLRWFGILVPQSLRQAQSSFREGLLLAAEVATLQNSIENTQRQYRQLLDKKRAVLAQAH